MEKVKPRCISCGVRINVSMRMDEEDNEWGKKCGGREIGIPQRSCKKHLITKKLEWSRKAVEG